jgi:hypothetical protein
MWPKTYVCQIKQRAVRKGACTVRLLSIGINSGKIRSDAAAHMALVGACQNAPFRPIAPG